MKIHSLVRRSETTASFILGTVCVCLLVAVVVNVQPAWGTTHTALDTNKPTSPATTASQRPWMNRSLSPQQRADLLIKQMTLDEKIVMMHGVNAMKGTVDTGFDWAVPPNEYVGLVPPIRRLGIPPLTLADGRAGVGNKAKNVTLLPAPIAAASSWDTALLNQFGRVLGEEQWGKGTKVELGPSIDVVRVPEWGRTFESYGEDPYLNGQMAAAEIKGIQSQGPIADANMYLTMNQEDDRFREDSIVDERTLQEIYLPPFEASVRDGHVGTFMCAYVKTNGVYSCENAHILHDLLRDQLKFDGWVMSDWGATHSTVDCANNGLDQQMPDDTFYGAALKKAVEAGQVSVSTIDEHVRHILVPMFRFGLFDKVQPGTWTSNVRSPQHDAFSRMVAEQGTILLKNDQSILPIPLHASIAVVGEAGNAKPKAEGGGSSEVVAPYVVTPLDGVRKRVGTEAEVSYADGSDLSAASKAAEAAQIALVFVHTDETEGRDRPNLELPGNQDHLIEAVAAANKHTIVVLDTGGPVLMPWADQVAGIIEAWYPGQEDGNAIAAILYGDVNPSAKLPLTFPRTAAEIPTASKEQWPGIGGRSIYSEALNVGYRWYDATNTQPLFPFGFGLSYTTFRLSHLAVEPAKLELSSNGAPRKVLVKVDVTNTGKRKGAEVVQVYVGQPPANGEPPHELRAFAKVQLDPGETRPVSLELNDRSFSIFDPSQHHWISPPGTYEILVGTSSRDLPLHRSVTVEHVGTSR
ncbi:MAG: glycoside hydrolase family 3 C-terminal domain-containing protein [Terracidiphilus sp.]